MENATPQLADLGAALVWEGPNPGRVLHNLPKIALYADKMLVPDPLAAYSVPPVTTGRFSEVPNWQESAYPDGSPEGRPSHWAEFFGRCALHVCSLAPWVRDDYIVAIPPPALWNAEVGDALNALVQFVASPAADDLYNKLLALEPDLKVTALVDSMSDIDPADREDWLAALGEALGLDEEAGRRVRERLTKASPWPDWLTVPASGHEEVRVLTYGGGLAGVEAEHLLAELNVYVSSSRPISWLRFNSAMHFEEAPALDRALRDLPLAFRTRIPLDVVYELRGWNKLGGFREYLQREFQDYLARGEGEPEEQFAALSEHIGHAFEEYTDEWDEVTAILKTKGLETILQQAASTAGVAYHELGIVTFILGTAANIRNLNDVGGSTLRAARLRRNPLFILNSLR